MSISIVVDAESLVELATNRGYGNLCRWIDTLDSDEYLPLAHLRQHGSWDGGAELVDAIERALAEEPPADETVVQTARELQRIARSGDAFVVTDGMMRDDS